MLFPRKTLPEGYHRWSVFNIWFGELDLITFGMEIYVILVKVSPEAEPEARIKVHVVY